MPRIYNADGTFEDVEHINGYLLAGPDIYVESRTTPICPVPKIITGNRPADGGNLILSEEEKNLFIEKYPKDKKFIHQIMSGDLPPAERIIRRSWIALQKELNKK